MRLEQLFQQLAHFSNGASIFDKRAAISVLLDILMIFSRNDLKSELLKELERHSKFLRQLSNSQQVDAEKLTLILNELNEISQKLYNINGLFKIELF